MLKFLELIQAFFNSLSRRAAIDTAKSGKTLHDFVKTESLYTSIKKRERERLPCLEIRSTRLSYVLTLIRVDKAQMGERVLINNYNLHRV